MWRRSWSRIPSSPPRLDILVNWWLTLSGNSGEPSGFVNTKSNSDKGVPISSRSASSQPLCALSVMTALGLSATRRRPLAVLLISALRPKLAVRTPASREG